MESLVKSSGSPTTLSKLREVGRRGTIILGTIWKELRGTSSLKSHQSTLTQGVEIEGICPREPFYFVPQAFGEILLPRGWIFLSVNDHINNRLVIFYGMTVTISPYEFMAIGIEGSNYHSQWHQGCTMIIEAVLQKLAMVLECHRQSCSVPVDEVEGFDKHQYSIKSNSFFEVGRSNQDLGHKTGWKFNYTSVSRQSVIIGAYYRSGITRAAVGYWSGNYYDDWKFLPDAPYIS
ncbi:hypothetical protein FVEG_06991 [Fusarium verticillioides 7600]|uniref:Uncharacterized protein n=1 Tax=Gibberella moniliformis (strain M3125 / FGSC 7600) TaxID=334819 RepID=W7M4P4_GIBM7|nr:hypothetical protein FVEG_06991 [Fusarium verticillioides 7600]EWG46543.1 hypothetical protein FVEG_06991 [Fusarium verticillioides 7600]